MKGVGKTALRTSLEPHTEPKRKLEPKLHGVYPHQKQEDVSDISPKTPTQLTVVALWSLAALSGLGAELLSSDNPAVPETGLAYFAPEGEDP